VPGMAQNSRGGSPRARYQRSRRLGEGQGRASRGGVWRKPNPHVRGDAQEADRRCGTPGTSGHVTTPSSIRALGVLDTSGVDARPVRWLPLGGLHAVRQRGALSEEASEPTGMQTSAEGIVGPAPARLVRHPTADRRGHGEAEPPRGWAEGPNGGQEGSPHVGPRPRTCPAAGAARRGAEGGSRGWSIGRRPAGGG
jgi:hypothetical protein